MPFPLARLSASEVWSEDSVSPALYPPAGLLCAFLEVLSYHVYLDLGPNTTMSERR